MPKIFISYRREDSIGITGRIYDRLGAHFGRDCVFMDVDAIPFGVDFREHLSDAVGACDVLLAVIGEQWLTVNQNGQPRLLDARDFVRIEIEAALQRGIPVIPVLLGKTSMPHENELPASLANLAFRNAAPVDPGRDFHHHVDRLIRGLEKLAERQPSSQGPKADGKTASAGDTPDPETAGSQTAKEVDPQAQAAASPEPVSVPCPGCGRAFKVTPSLWFKKVKCRRCGAVFSPNPISGTVLIRAPETAAREAVDVPNPMSALLVPMPGEIAINSLGINFAWVPPGSSWLGGGGGKLGMAQFTLKRGVRCGIYPVTQAEWQKVMGGNPSQFRGNPRFPVESVSWNDVKKFLEKLNARDGEYSYRLPTEQEWEYICRGGPINHDQSKFHYYFAKSKTDLTPNPTDDLSGKANFGNQMQKPSVVGSYLPNPLGIYDMHGNVWEWMESSQGSGRMIRGGGWFNVAEYCAASYCGTHVADYSNSIVGFRLLAVPRNGQ